MSFNCYDNVSKPKRYIQFNDLVFTGRKSIDEQSESLSLRESKVSRTFANGSYVANRGEVSLIDSNSISLKIALPTTGWNQEHVEAHYEFAMRQLMTPGKLWAINTGLQLVWCNAYVTSIQKAKEWVVTDDDYLVFNVEFDNPDGVWYKANEAYTYLEDYSQCQFLEMKAQCLGKSRVCCNEPYLCNEYCECCADKCDDMEDMIDLCTAQVDPRIFNDFFEECNTKWRIVYNCEMCKKDNKPQDNYPHTVCDICVNDVMSGSFMSLATLPTKKWSFALFGKFKDPVITLNAETVSISGEYDGVLTINHKGQIKYAKSWECIEYDYEEIDLTALKTCATMPTVQDGLNQISVSGVVGESACIYIDYERVTV